MTTTMNAKLNVLEQMMDTVAAPRTKSAGALPLQRQTQPVARVRRAVRRPLPPAPAESLWRVTLAEAKDSVAESLLSWTLAATAAAGLGWLALTMVRFFLAWESLVTWVRSAML